MLNNARARELNANELSNVTLLTYDRRCNRAITAGKAEGLKDERRTRGQFSERSVHRTQVYSSQQRDSMITRALHTGSRKQFCKQPPVATAPSV